MLSKNVKKIWQNQKGITLIALAVTIAILLILAGATINMVAGEGGFLKKNKEIANAQKEYVNTQDTKVNSLLNNLNEIKDIKLAESISINKKTAGLTVNGTVQLQATVLPEDTTNKAVNWTSSNPEVATVDENGLVTALAIGNTVITAKTKDGSGQIAQCTVSVVTSMAIDRSRTGNIDVKFVKYDSTKPVGEQNTIIENEADLPTPKLGANMTAVKYNETTKSWDKVTNPETDKSWYSYTKENKQWANAVVNVGGIESYFVWIPRYCYKIEYVADDNKTVIGYSDSRGIVDINDVVQEGTQKQGVTEVGDHYVLHPAFANGESSGYLNGEWNSELSGIWVAKYEASRSDATVSGAGSATTLKVVPSVQSWRSISVSSIYDTCTSYSTANNSHMMKNSEWGACAYLSKSKYGKETEEVWINPNSNYVTGQAGSGASVGETTSTNNYNEENGPKASTTGTVYGIYDMSGGAYEYIASYVDFGTGNSNLTDYGKNLYDQRDSKKYFRNTYAVGSTETGDVAKQSNYEANSNKYGDAVYETSSQETGSTSWHQDFSVFPSSDDSFFERGGYWHYPDNAGVFSFSGHSGRDLSSFSFRPVLVVI